jgi:FkbM family methyltransferase
MRLVQIRLGSAKSVYSVCVPQWPHPVFVRGGSSSDTMVLYEILVTREYDLVFGMESAKTIIDGGANIGLAAIYFLNTCPKSRVVLVEPFEETLNICRKNLEPYGDRAICLQGAIWPYPGKVDLEATGEDHWTNKVKMSADGGKSGATDAIVMPTLIEMCGGSVDLLKLDVEGSEREIFAHNTASWLPAIRNVVIELHGQDCSESFFGALSPYNYEVTNQDMVYFCRNIKPRAAA